MQLQKFQGIDPFIIGTIIVTGDVSPLVKMVEKDGDSCEETFLAVKSFVQGFLNVCIGSVESGGTHKLEVIWRALISQSNQKNTKIRIPSYKKFDTDKARIHSLLNEFKEDLETFTVTPVLGVRGNIIGDYFFSLSLDYKLKTLGYVKCNTCDSESTVSMSETHTQIAIKKLESTLVSEEKGALYYVQLAKESGGYRVSPSLVSNTREIIVDHALYPFFDKPPEQFIEEFMESSSTILFLLGDPGSGKSSLIRYMAKNYTVNVVDDSRAFDGDGVPVISKAIMESKKNWVYAFEEIEADLRERSGNDSPFIKSLLQVSSGIVKTEAKIVICLNHVSVGQIDEALRRSDRCYGVIQFRKLTPQEATEASKVIGKDQVYGESVALSDIFTKAPVGVKKQSFGFAPALA